jgi:hypothetical protein
VPAVRQILFIVAAGRQDLMEHLRRQFADVPAAVEIVTDRRAGERRLRDAPVGVNRRATDRRANDIESDLLTIGWAMVRRS